MLGTVLIFIKRSRIALLALLLVTACTPGGGGDGAPRIVATTSVAGDLVERVTAGRATVEVLVPVGADPHDFQPSAQQAANLRDADLVVAWGLGLEEGLVDVLESVTADGVAVLALSERLDPQPFATAAEGHEEEGEEDHQEHALDPHTWMDPVRMADAARLIGAELAVVAPGVDWVASAEQAAGELLGVHAEIESILSAVPSGRRKLVTNHDALGYFAARYGFEIVGVAIRGGSTLASPSSADIAELVDVIRETGVEVLFAETTNPAALLEAVAEEVEGVAVVALLTGSLAEPGEPGDTLPGMLVEDARRIAEALAG